MQTGKDNLSKSPLNLYPNSLGFSSLRRRWKREKSEEKLTWFLWHKLKPNREAIPHWRDILFSRDSEVHGY